MRSLYIRNFPLLLLLLITLSACVQKTMKTAEPPIINTSSASANVVPSAQTEDIVPSQSLAQAFEKVLLNEIPFFYTRQNSNPVYQGSVYLSEITEKDQNTMAPSQFAVVDLDGDGTPEVVYQRSDYRGFVILRYKEGDVYGYGMNYRSFMDLKKDGSSYGASGVTNYYIGKIRF